MKIESNGETFCCCCPLKFGLYIVEFFILFLLVQYSFHAIFLFFNEYFDTSYPGFLLLLTFPLWVSVFFFCCYFSSSTKSGRRMLFWAVIIAIITLILYTTWEIVYITALYDRTYVY